MHLSGPALAVVKDLHKKKQDGQILLFPSKTHKDKPAEIKTAWYTAAKRAKLENFHFHDLRHTAASLMLNNGIPPIIASRRLGHSRVSITLDTYGHLMPEMQSEAAELMDELITPIPVNYSQLLTPKPKDDKTPIYGG